MSDSFDPIVRRFFGDDDVVHVPFAVACGRDANHLGVPLQGGDVRAPAIAHAGTEAAHQLIDHRADAASMSHPSPTPLRHEILAGLRARLEVELVLEVAIAASAPHGAE